MASSVTLAEAVAALVKKTNKMETDIQGLSSRVDALETRVDALENSNPGSTTPPPGMIGEYQAEYSETFGDFLLNNGGDDYLKRVLANYPAFVVGEVTIDFVPLFKNRNFYKEIGSETEELFRHNLERLADEVYTRNAIQINAYLAQADTFTQRSIDDTDTTTDFAYLNPVDAPAVINNQAKLAGATKRTYDFKVWLGGNKSNAELVKEIADLYALYNDMLDSFDILFLGVH